MNTSKESNQGVYVEAPTPEAIAARNQAILSILTAGRGDDVTKEALSVLRAALSPSVVITNNVFGMNPEPK